MHKLDKIIPKLNFNSRKGNFGRIGVVGGCFEYTGAPYFAAISSLETGADLAHVICTVDAAPVIKSYSPELIVHPLMKEFNSENEFQTRLNSIKSVISRLDVLVIGPGLGRDDFVLQLATGALNYAKELKLPLVLDADALYLLQKNVGLIKGFKNIIITPNEAELERLCKSLEIVDDTRISQCKRISNTLGATVLSKGIHDFIISGDELETVDTESSPRRCGGQGDLLAGSLAAFIAWNKRSTSAIDLSNCALAASTLIRTSAALAYADHGRSMLASKIIPYIGPAFRKLFEN